MMSRLNTRRARVPARWQRFAQICPIAMTCVPAHAVSVGQVDAFAAGDAAFWQQPHALNPPVRIASNGALGPTDCYLLVQTTGAAAGAAARMVAINDGQWTGNFGSVLPRWATRTRCGWCPRSQHRATAVTSGSQWPGSTRSKRKL